MKELPNNNLEFMSIKFRYCVNDRGILPGKYWTPEGFICRSLGIRDFRFKSRFNIITNDI